ncbi:MAG: hypothetical protein KJ674_04280 [Nanoarchaeota archaeon]|nr:hypothetical protein [Nanoarchaeota archaeon]
MKKINLILIFLALLLVFNVNAESDFIELDDYDVFYSYDIPESGDKFTLTVTITNNDDNTKENIDFDLNLEYPFDNVGDDDWSMDVLGVEESKTKHFRIEVSDNALNDDYDIGFNLNDDTDDYDDFFTIEVKSIIPELVIGAIRSDPSNIVADREDIKLMIDIQNIGGGDAKFVRANLILPDGFSNSNSFSDISNLGTISEGETIEAVFYVDTNQNLNLNSYGAVIELEYKDENNDNKVDMLDFDLPVKGIPQFLILNVITEPSDVFSGDTVKLKLNLKNIGSEEAKETSVKVFEKTDYPFSFTEKTNFIGNVKPGAIGEALFEFEVEKNADVKTYLVNVQIRTVSGDNVLVTEETIPIIISEEEDINNPANLKLFMLVFAFIVVVLMIILLIKRR